jgi:hypothetical protein
MYKKIMSNTAFKTSSTNQITNQPPAESDIILRSDASAESTTVTIYGEIPVEPPTAATTAEGEFTCFGSSGTDSLIIIGGESITVTEDGSAPWAANTININTTTLGGSADGLEMALAIKEVINNIPSTQIGISFHSFVSLAGVSATLSIDVVTAIAAIAGEAGNLPTTETGGNGSWAAATLTGGADEITEEPSTEDIVIDGEIESVSVESFTAINQASAGTTPSGNITAFSAGTAAEGDISALTNPSDGAILTIGLEGNIQAYRFKNTTAAAYDVNIGASASDTMLSLKRALNADGTPGVDYHAGTLINPLLSGTVATVVITVTDRLDCKRQLAWTFTEAATDFALRIPRGGEDGTILFSLSPTVEIAADNLTFSTEDHSTDTLPALRIAESVTVSVGGDIAAYRIYNELAIKVVFQTSTDQINWLDTAEGELTLGADTTTFTNFTLPTEFLRFKVTENLSVIDGVLDARVIY